MKVVSSLQVVSLDEDLLAADGRVLAAKGSAVIVAPQTLDKAVVLSNGQTLADFLPSVSLDGHDHPETQRNLLQYYEELIRLADRVTKIELARSETA